MLATSRPEKTNWKYNSKPLTISHYFLEVRHYISLHPSSNWHFGVLQNNRNSTKRREMMKIAWTSSLHHTWNIYGDWSIWILGRQIDSSGVLNMSDFINVSRASVQSAGQAYTEYICMEYLSFYMCVFPPPPVCEVIISFGTFIYCCCISQAICMLDVSQDQAHSYVWDMRFLSEANEEKNKYI